MISRFGIRLFERGELLGALFRGEDENVAHFDRARGFDGLVPLGIAHFPDAAAELRDDGVGFLLSVAEEADADGFAAFDHLDDQIGISSEPFLPSVHPLRGGEFRPDEHGELQWGMRSLKNWSGR